MTPLFLEVTEETSKWTTGEQHTAALLGIILTILGICVAYYKLRVQHKNTITSREEAVIARNNQQVLLEEIAKEFKPNHGSSLVDRVNSIGESVSNHHKVADKFFEENAKAHDEIKEENEKAHQEIHRRIDGMFELMAGGTATTPRKTAARHFNREEPS